MTDRLGQIGKQINLHKYLKSYATEKRQENYKEGKELLRHLVALFIVKLQTLINRLLPSFINTYHH